MYLGMLQLSANYTEMKKKRKHHGNILGYRRETTEQHAHADSL